MIQASASFTAQDVSTQCRVRRSPYASTPQFEEPMDMKATIRHWQPKRYYGFVQPNNKHLKQGLKALRMVQDDVNNGPELVLSSIQQWPEEPVSPTGFVERNSNSFEGRDRFESFGSMKQQRKLQKKKAIGNSTVAEEDTKTSKPQQLIPQLPPIVIPLSDVVVVDVYHGNTKHMNLTTKTSGFFELRFETHNSYDVMLACLAATLPEDRIFGMIEKLHTKPATHTSFDVDTLTATRIAERMQRETVGEKLRRRLRRLCLNVEEMSSSIADNCGCGTNDQHLNSATNQMRDSAPSLNIFPCTLEMDDDASTLPDGEKTTSNPKLSLLPSGLSVESADPSVAVWDDSKKKIVTSTTGSSSPLPKLAETDCEPSDTPQT